MNTSEKTIMQTFKINNGLQILRILSQVTLPKKWVKNLQNTYLTRKCSLKIWTNLIKSTKPLILALKKSRKNLDKFPVVS